MTNEGLYQFSSALEAYLMHTNMLAKSVYFRFKELVDNGDADEAFLQKVKTIGLSEEEELKNFLTISYDQLAALIEFLDQPPEEQKETENET